MSSGEARGIAFGVDCFHFGITCDRRKGETLSLSDYLAFLESTLQAVPGVDRLSIERQPSFADAVLRALPTGRSLSEGRAAFPRVRSHRITFTLTIPAEEQAQYFEGDPWSDSPESEKFMIDMRPNFWGIPVVYVAPADAGFAGSLFSSVLLVRRYLKAKICGTSGLRIRFESLEELPPVVECYLTVGTSEFDAAPLASFWWKYSETRFGDSLNIKYNAASFKSIEHAAEELCDDAADELGLMFHVEQQTKADTREWNSVIEEISRVSDYLAATGIGGRIRRFFRLSGATNRIVSEATRLDVSRKHSSFEVMSFYDDLVRDKTRPMVFKTIVERQLHSRPPLPAQEVIGLADFAERKREHNLGLLVMAVIGLIAAALGSLLTLWVSGTGGGQSVAP